MRKDRYECPRFMPGGSVISSVMAGVLLFSLVALSPSARTATFDETVSAPRDLSGAELRSKARVFFTPFEIGSLSMIDVVRDSAKRAELTDLWWHLSRFVDERKSLADLASYGVTPNADASYSIDLNRFPQWDSLDQRMLTGLNTGSLDRTLADLKHRGFRDSDIEGLRKYLKQHNPELLAIAAADPVTEGFAAKIKRQRAIGRKLAADEMMAYDYQMAHATNEAYRAWALGVMNSLDQHRQRVLESYLMEGLRFRKISADDFGTREERLDYVEKFLVSGAYVQSDE